MLQHLTAIQATQHKILISETERLASDLNFANVSVGLARIRTFSINRKRIQPLSAALIWQKIKGRRSELLNDREQMGSRLFD